MSKPCEIDNKTVFERKEEYTTFCSICQNYTKIYKFRSCQYRHQKEKENGNDILSAIEQSNRIAQAQTGQKISPIDGVEPIKTSLDTKTGVKITKSKPKRHRGR